MPTNPPVYRSPLLSYFDFSHLPAYLQEVSGSFARVAIALDRSLAGELYLHCQHKRRELLELCNLPDGQERALVEAMPSAHFLQLHDLPPNLTAAYLQTERAIEHLLTAKDCAVRAALSIVKAAKACEHVRYHCDKGHEAIEGVPCPTCAAQPTASQVHEAAQATTSSMSKGEPVPAPPAPGLTLKTFSVSVEANEPAKFALCGKPLEGHDVDNCEDCENAPAEG